MVKFFQSEKPKMDARIHTCPTCKKTYTGIVCSPCFAKASSSDRHGFFRGLIKNDPTEIKIKKFHDYYHNFNQDLKESQYQEKPTLKVFKIIVWEHGADQRVQRDIIVMLARNPANAIKLCGYNGDEFEFEWEELEGPFKEGSILSSWADIND